MVVVMPGSIAQESTVHAVPCDIPWVLEGRLCARHVHNQVSKLESAQSPRKLYEPENH